MRVYESKDSYYTVPDSRIFKSASIAYWKARQMNSPEEESKENSIDVLFASLMHACEFFEADYLKQVENIRRIIDM